MDSKEIENQMASVIQHLKGNESYSFFVKYFEMKREEEIKHLVNQSGCLTQEALIEANAKLQVYEELIHFDNTLRNDLK